MTEDEIKDRIRTWLRGKLRAGGPPRPGLSAVRAEQPIDIHVDELMADLKTAKNRTRLRAALLAYEILVSQIADINRYMPSLTIFLRESRELLAVPVPAQLSRSMGSTPPGLYVYDREFVKRLHVHELYVRPYALPVESPVGVTLFASYRAGRNPSKNVLGERYVRYIELESFPDCLAGRGSSQAVSFWSTNGEHDVITR